MVCQVWFVFLMFSNIEEFQIIIIETLLSCIWSFTGNVHLFGVCGKRVVGSFLSYIQISPLKLYTNPSPKHPLLTKTRSLRPFWKR